MPKPDAEYKIDVGKTFIWKFTNQDPENDKVKVSVKLRNGIIEQCGCSKLKKDTLLDIWVWTFKPTVKMAGQQITVLASLSDAVNTAQQGFIV